MNLFQILARRIQDPTPNGNHRDRAPTLSRLVFASTAINAVLFFTIVSCASLSYDTNDDPIMMSIAAGLGAALPDDHLVFSHVLVGRCLRILYTWNRDINWYSCYLLGTNYLATTFLLVVFWSREATLRSTGLWMLLFLQFQLPFLLRLQFTVTAVAASLAGLLIVVTHLRRPGIGAAALLVLGVALMLLGSLIRRDAFFLTLLLAIPFVLYELWLLKAYSRTVLLGCVILAAILLGYFDERCYETDSGWKAFRELLALRGQIHDSRASVTLATSANESPDGIHMLRSVGWTSNDAQMFLAWNFADPVTFASERLAAIANYGNGVRPIREGVQRFWHYLMRVRLFLLIGAFDLAFILAVISVRHRDDLVLAMAGVLLLGAVLLGLGYQKRLPARVAVPAVQIAITLVAVRALTRQGSDLAISANPRVERMRGATRLLSWSTGAILLLLLAQHAGNLVRINTANKARAAECRQLVEGLTAQFDPDEDGPVFVTWGGEFPWEWFPALWNWREVWDWQFIRLDWSTRSPPYERMLTRHGISDLHLALYQRTNLLLVADPDKAALLVRFVEEHFGDTVHPVLLFERDLRDDGRTIAVYRLVRDGRSRIGKQT
jgi:hypothetical protein